jgi:hypothetical protein
LSPVLGAIGSTRLDPGGIDVNIPAFMRIPGSMARLRLSMAPGMALLTPRIVQEMASLGPTLVGSERASSEWMSAVTSIARTMLGMGFLETASVKLIRTRNSIALLTPRGVLSKVNPLALNLWLGVDL